MNQKDDGSLGELEKIVKLAGNRTASGIGEAEHQKEGEWSVQQKSVHARVRAIWG